MGNCSSFINLFRHDDFLLQFAMLPNGGRLLSNSMRVSTSSSFLYLFLFFINWCAFGFYLVLRLSAVEKDHRGLEHQCSFARLYLFLFAFLIICIETSCIFDYLYWDFLHFWLFVLRLLVFRRFFCNITFVVCEDWSPVWYSGLWD